MPRRVARLAAQAGAGDLAAEATALGVRAAEGLFNVACVGDFKRGKSTLVNALVETAVLPTGVIPVTSVPTVIRYGDLGARVRIRDAWQAVEIGEVAEYVAQDRNPGNIKGVSGIEVRLPHRLLRDGLCLVDTPGLGSVFEANTASTEQFLPHVDAAIVVLGANPPISRDELRFVTRLSAWVDPFLFVLNKSDQVPAAERREAAAFTQRVLEGALGRGIRPLWEVSALAAKRDGSLTEGWRTFVAALERLSREAGRRLAATSLARGMDRIGGRLQVRLEEELTALLAPLDASERRKVELRGLAGSAYEFRSELGPRLAGAEQHLAATFEERRRAFLAGAAPQARARLQKRFEAAFAAGQMRRRDDGMELANEVAREELEPWLLESERAAGAAYAAVTTRFTTIAQGFLDRLAATVKLDASAMRLGDAPSAAFQGKRGFSFANLMYRRSAATPWAWLLDRLAPASVTRRRWLRAVVRHLDDLLVVNAHRVEGDLRDRVAEGQRQLRAGLDRLLAEVGTVAVQAVARGQETREAGAEGVRTARARLEGWITQLAALRRAPVVMSAPSAPNTAHAPDPPSGS